MKVLSRSERTKHLLQGFSSAFDITGQSYVRDTKSGLSGFQKDYLAVCSDWNKIGNDMRKAINKVMYGK